MAALQGQPVLSTGGKETMQINLKELYREITVRGGQCSAHTANTLHKSCIAHPFGCLLTLTSASSLLLVVAALPSGLEEVLTTSAWKEIQRLFFHPMAKPLK